VRSEPEQIARTWLGSHLLGDFLLLEPDGFLDGDFAKGVD
jgi:hypothetical protein